MLSYCTVYHSLLCDLCVIIYAIHLLLYLTGDSSRAPKKQKMLAKKKSVKQTASKPPRKGKESRPNYLTMDSVEYAKVRQSNWYRNVPRDENIEDPNF